MISSVDPGIIIIFILPIILRYLVVLVLVLGRAVLLVIAVAVPVQGCKEGRSLRPAA
jgi:hypothetical protein